MASTFNAQTLTDRKKERIITALYIGILVAIVAIIALVYVPNRLFDALVNFFTSLILAPIPGTVISVPAPIDPGAHTVLYRVAFQLSLSIGLLEIAVLALRVYLQSPLARKAETIENIVFWLGTSYLIITYLIDMTITSQWFVFWTGILLIAGLSLLARSFVLLAKR